MRHLDHLDLKLSMRIIRVSFALVLALTALTTSLGVVSADRDTATVIFYGRATTSGCDWLPGYPVTCDDPPIPLSDDGTTQVNFSYVAKGVARGSLGGTFDLYQDGSLILPGLNDPAAEIKPVTPVVTRYEIVLDPHRPGPLVTIRDTAPTKHDFWTVTAQVSDIPTGVMRYLRLVFDHKLLAKDASLTYALFTFTFDGEEFVGYATPDFGEFAIEITFDKPADYRGGQDHNDGE